MKYTLTLAAALSFCILAGCNSEADHHHDDATHHTATAAPATDGHAHTALHLNEGKKWTTDGSTRQHARAMTSLAAAFHPADATPLAAYYSYAEAMQKELDKLIQGCRMNGAEHDALHLWLEPVMEDVRALKQSITPDEAAAASRKLRQNVLYFDQYFQ